MRLGDNRNAPADTTVVDDHGVVDKRDALLFVINRRAPTGLLRRSVAGAGETVWPGKLSKLLVGQRGDQRGNLFGLLLAADGQDQRGAGITTGQRTITCDVYLHDPPAGQPPQDGLADFDGMDAVQWH